MSLSGYFVVFNENQIVSPSSKIMLAELKREWEYPFSTVPYYDGSPAWQWDFTNRVNGLAVRHQGKSVAAFPDGHTEVILPKYGLQPEHFKPTY